ncbi:hypothetical protein K5549_005242 [Capra hircus]|nr:hypothetical protein K5549_005242 [Capra hircus]
MASPKSMPKDAQMMAQILKGMGIPEYEPRVINQMLEVASWYVTTILDDAKFIQCPADQSFTSPPPRDIARQRNQTPLPLIKPYLGPRLPPDRYCLTAPNYRLKSLQKKKLSVGSVTSRPSTPMLGTPTPQAMSVSTKVGTPVSLTGQRFTAQMPTSQSPAVKASIPAASAVQNVLINLSLIGSQILFLPLTWSSNALKRKYEDNDDDD